MQYSYREPNLKYITKYLPETISIGIYPALSNEKGKIIQIWPVFLRIKTTIDDIDKLRLTGEVVCKYLEDGTLKPSDFESKTIWLDKVIKFKLPGVD